MASSKGVIQGYTGVAAVDSRSASLRHRLRTGAPPADAGYYSERNLKALAEENIPALIAYNGMRKRDERFKSQTRYKALPDALYDKAHPKKVSKTYRPKYFTYNPQTGTCLCPIGKTLYKNGSNCKHNGYS